MRENLIPEQRADKNGRLTTRWVKPVSDSGASFAKMPAPAITPTAPTVDYDAEIRELLRDTMMQYGDNPRPFISKASEHILSYIHENLLDDTKNEYFKGEVSSLLSDNTEEHVVEAYLHLYDFHNGRLDDMEAVSFLRGALDSGSNPPKGYDRNDPERAKSIQNMFRFIHETDPLKYAMDFSVKGVTSNTHYDAVSTRIKDPMIADFIIQNGDQTDTLITIANDHPREIYGILEAARNNPEQLEEIRDLFINHPERVAGRDPSDISAILEASRNWTPVSEGTL
jgi:hypothetical protein